MARRKKKTAEPRFQWVRDINWANVRRGSIAAAWMLGVTGAFAAMVYGVPRLEAYAVRHSDIDARNIVIRFIEPPAWLQGELEERLIEAVRAQIVGDPFVRIGGSDRDLPAARDALLNTGWFDAVAQVRRTNAHQIEVEADFADPYALIRNHEGDHLVDPRGRLLPRTFPEGQADHFMVITGTRFGRPARPGLEWEGSDVVAALRLLKEIETQPWREQVRMIDATGQWRASGTGVIKLITDRGSWILWGSPPGEEAPLEALTEQKLRYLNHNHATFGHIDGNHRGEVDITDHKRVINR